MSSAHTSATRVVPAQLATLSIYNPSLGATDETVRDQILYYYSRAQRERKEKSKIHESDDEAENEEEENQKLRQIGLAQGMVDFAANFSDDKSMDSVDTEKSRIVLHELERGWWILASIDLTRLAHPARASDKSSGPHVEYSAREVAPAQLLLQQLLRAHAIFLLHHASNLRELYQRSGRPMVTGLLEKYWTGFARSWDVLLHGHPIVDLYNGVKLAAGGELGVGVGEEEWGSGEREVLEDFVARTEGLADLIVSRFGDAPEPVVEGEPTGTSPRKTKQPSPWLDRDEDPRPSDGVIFSGTGAISRRSLATVSQWMEAIFKYEEDAYGVGENPSRHRSKRRKLLGRPKSSNEDPAAHKFAEGHPATKSPHTTEVDFNKEAMARNAAPPGIPPSLVPVVEQRLDQAVVNVEKSKKPASKPKPSDAAADQDASSFDTEKMFGYLKLGYGSSWTLSPRGLPGNQIEGKETPSQESNKTTDGTGSNTDDAVQAEAPELQEVDPAPEVSDDEEETPFVQRFEQSIGKFIIGLSGDLENTEFEDSRNEADHAKVSVPQRLFLRTLTVETSQSTMGPQRHSKDSSYSIGTYSQGGEPPTSASSSIDGAQTIFTHQKLQVAVYVHQPFIFLFLFQLHTPSLTIPSFYRGIHHQLGPLQKPLLSSTDPTKVALRIALTLGESSKSSTATPTKDVSPSHTIYDAVYDPVRLSVRTSIPNIPLPGSLAAEGLGPSSAAAAAAALTISGSWYTLGIPIGAAPLPSAPPRQTHARLVPSEWTRVEALHVHTQVLNTWIATRDGSEVERTVKTGRAWWVGWLLVGDAAARDGRGKKEAVLVRRALEQRGAGRAEKGGGSGGGRGRWLLREQQRETSGSSVGSNEQGLGTSSRGVSEGVGVDVRRYVGGLLLLSR